MKCDIVLKKNDLHVITDGARSPIFDILKDYVGDKQALELYALTRTESFEKRFSNKKLKLKKITNPALDIRLIPTDSKFTPKTFHKFEPSAVLESIADNLNKGFLVENPAIGVFEGPQGDDIVFSESGIALGGVEIKDNVISDIKILKQFKGQNLEDNMLDSAIQYSDPGTLISTKLVESYPNLITRLMESGVIERTREGIAKRDNSYQIKDLFKEATSTSENLPLKLVPSTINMMINLKVNSVEALLDKLSKLAPNGILDLTEGSLIKVFTEYEAKAIAESDSNRANITEIYNKAKSLDIGLLEYNEHFATTNSTETIDGVQTMNNPYIEEQKLITAVSGSKDILEDIPEAFRDLYLKNKDFAKYVEYIANNFDKVPSYSIRNGELVFSKSMNPKLAERRVKKSSPNVEENMALIEDIEYMKENYTPLSIIRKYALDLSSYITNQGLPINSSSISTLEDIDNIVELARELTSFQTSSEDYSFEDISDLYNNIQNKNETIDKVVFSSDSSSDIHLQELDGMNEIEIMNSFDLIRVSEGLYRKIESLDVKELVELAKDNYIFGTEGLTDVNEVYNKIVELGSRSRLSSDASADVFTNTVYKLSEFIPLENNSTAVELIKSIPSSELSIQDLMAIEEYIKYQNSDSYPLVLNESGIEFKNMDPISMINTYVETSDIAGELEQYSNLSKNFNYDYTNDFIPDSIEEQRFVAYNYPLTVKEYTGNTKVIQDTLAISNLNTPFTRIGDKIYEKVGELNEVSFYKEGPEIRQDFLVTEIEKPSTSIEVGAYEYLSTDAVEATITKTKTLDNLKC